jgi:glycosyltransferase involved in cell wall biosynthesis
MPVQWSYGNRLHSGVGGRKRSFMRVGLVSYEFPPQGGLGGVGTYAFRLAGALGKSGHEVVVLAGPSEGRETRLENVTVHRLPARYDPPVRSRACRWLYWRMARLLDISNPLVWHWLRWDMASGQALMDIHRCTPLDVIEAPEHAANGLVVGKMRHWPTALRLHGPWELFFGINRNQGTSLNLLLSELEKRSLFHADVVTTPSRTMAAFMQKRWHLPSAPQAIPNFMDVPTRPVPLPRLGSEQRIVCAGRIERFKGQDNLVKAFASIADRHPRSRLVLIGPDQWSRKQSFSAAIDAMVPNPEIRRRIDLSGAVSLSETQQELRRARVVVVPSSGFESFSFSTLEAMAAARPTIVSRAGAMPELLDYGHCGMIVTPGKVSELADALDRLLSDRDLCEKLAVCAHERARSEYDTQAVLPAFIASYREARERFGATAPEHQGEAPLMEGMAEMMEMVSG